MVVWVELETKSKAGARETLLVDARRVKAETRRLRRLGYQVWAVDRSDSLIDSRDCR
jgi:hypothetical protein